MWKEKLSSASSDLYNCRRSKSGEFHIIFLLVLLYHSWWESAFYFPVEIWPVSSVYVLGLGVPFMEDEEIYKSSNL